MQKKEELMMRGVGVERWLMVGRKRDRESNCQRTWIGRQACWLKVERVQVSEEGVERNGGDSGRVFWGDLTEERGDIGTQVRLVQVERRGERAGGGWGGARQSGRAEGGN